MRKWSSRIAWIPALLVGAAAAATAEMALGLLLYMRAGVLTALTLVLCIQASALGCGLWLAPRDSAPPWAGVRRAWILLVLAYVGGTVLAVSWEALGGLASTWVRRGLGLAMLTALPLYATGLVLGAPALSQKTGVTGPAAALGAAIGFAGIGLGGIDLHVAASTYVMGITLASAAALIHGSVLEARARGWQEWAESPLPPSSPVP